MRIIMGIEEANFDLNAKFLAKKHVRKNHSDETKTINHIP